MLNERRWFWTLALFASLTALLSARPYARGWNDGSRLATAECLVDQRTWQIDSSIFVVPPEIGSPYHPDDPSYRAGTLDKLLIDGHWYSDKSPVPALWLAFCYQILQSVFGLVASVHPRMFCSLMTLLSSGLAYIVAVLTIFQMGRVVGLAMKLRILLTVSFGMATLALPYANWVNAHLSFLTVTALMTVQLAYLAKGEDSPRRWAILGVLASLGYALDLGAGPPFVLALAGLALVKGRGVTALVVFLAAAFPVFFLHHWLNFQIGGTFVPANANPTYVQWPGSPFADMTGQWNHSSVGRFLLYTVELMVGKGGFLLNNLPLFLLIPGAVTIAKRRFFERAGLLALLTGCAGVWFMYAVSSRNLSGACCSIRWFVPMIAPGFFALAILLREQPRFQSDLSVLTLGGMIMMASAWSKPVWLGKLYPGFWIILAGTLIAWLTLIAVRRKTASSRVNEDVPLARAG